MRRELALIAACLGLAGAASAEDLHARLSGKVLYFAEPGEETLLFSLNPDGTGIGQETWNGRPRPEAIQWRVAGQALCLRGKPGGMTTSGREECLDIRVEGSTVWLLSNGRVKLKGEIRDQ